MTLPAELKSLLSEPKPLDIKMVEAWSKRVGDEFPPIITDWFDWFYKNFAADFWKQIFAYEDNEYWIVKKARAENKDPIQLAHKYLEEIQEKLLGFYLKEKENEIEPDSESEEKIRFFIKTQFENINKILNQSKKLVDEKISPEGLHLVLHIATRSQHPEPRIIGGLYENVSHIYTPQLVSSSPWPLSFERRINGIADLDLFDIDKAVQAVFTDTDKDPIEKISTLYEMGLITEGEVDSTNNYYRSIAAQLFDFIQTHLPYIEEWLPEENRDIERNNIILGYVQNAFLVVNKPKENVRVQDVKALTQQYLQVQIKIDTHLKTIVNDPVTSIDAVRKLYQKHIARDASRESLFAETFAKVCDYINTTNLEVESTRLFDLKICRRLDAEIHVETKVIDEDLTFFPIPRLEQEVKEIADGMVEIFESYKPTGNASVDRAILSEPFRNWISEQFETLMQFFNQLDGERSNIDRLVDIYADRKKQEGSDSKIKEILRRKYSNEIVYSYFLELSMLVSFIVKEHILAKQAAAKAKTIEDSIVVPVAHVSEPIVDIEDDPMDTDNDIETRINYNLQVLGNGMAQRFEGLFFKKQKDKWFEILKSSIDTPAKGIVKTTAVRDRAVLLTQLEVYWKLNLLVPANVEMELLEAFHLVDYLNRNQTILNLSDFSYSEDGKGPEGFITNLYTHLYNPKYGGRGPFTIHYAAPYLVTKTVDQTNGEFYDKVETRIRRIIVTNLLKKQYPNMDDYQIGYHLEKCENNLKAEHKKRADAERDELLNIIREFAKLGGIDIIEDPSDADTFIISQPSQNDKSKYIYTITHKVASFIVGNKNGAYRKDRPRTLLDPVEKAELYASIVKAIDEKNIDDCVVKIKEHRNLSMRDIYRNFVDSIQRLGRALGYALGISNDGEEVTAAPAFTSSLTPPAPVAVRDALLTMSPVEEDDSEALAVAKPTEDTKTAAPTTAPAPSEPERTPSSSLEPEKVDLRGPTRSLNGFRKMMLEELPKHLVPPTERRAAPCPKRLASSDYSHTRVR